MSFKVNCAKVTKLKFEFRGIELKGCVILLDSQCLSLNCAFDRLCDL